MPGTHFTAIPTFRINDIVAAKAFYLNYLGFTVDWEHYYAGGAPVYMQVSRDGFILHLSENERFRESVIVFVRTEGLAGFHRELIERSTETPELGTTPWNTQQLEIEDPFGNLMRFNE